MGVSYHVSSEMQVKHAFMLCVMNNRQIEIEMKASFKALINEDSKSTFISYLIVLPADKMKNSQAHLCK